MTNEDYQKIFHEIKNNITFINSSMQLVEKAHPEIKDYPYWKDSMQEVSALKHLLIELSSARLCDDLTLMKTSTEEFLPELVNSCIKLFDSADFHCQIKIEPSLPEIYIDFDRIKRAFYNLLKNSYEAMQGKGQIRIICSKEDSFVRIDLMDTGGGIAPEYLPKLFTPLATTKPNGTGLGLLISKQIIEAHSGHLSVESRPQEGTTFSIFLPCRHNIEQFKQN